MSYWCYTMNYMRLLVGCYHKIIKNKKSKTIRNQEASTKDSESTRLGE